MQANTQYFEKRFFSKQFLEFHRPSKFFMPDISASKSLVPDALFLGNSLKNANLSQSYILYNTIYSKARDPYVRKNNQLLFITHQCLQNNCFLQVFVFGCSDRKWIRILDDVTNKRTKKTQRRNDDNVCIFYCLIVHSLLKTEFSCCSLYLLPWSR
jgi:hypothetical protein